MFSLVWFADSALVWQVWRHLMLHCDHTEHREQSRPDEVAREQRVVVGLLLDWCGLRGEGYTEQEVNRYSTCHPTNLAMSTFEM